MDALRRTEIAVGALFILATVSSSLGFLILDPILDDPDTLGRVASDQAQVLTAAILLLVDAVAVIVIPILLFPIFRQQNETLGRLYPLSRVVEAVVLVIGVVGLLSLLTLSRDYEQPAPDASDLQAAGASLVAIYDWGVLLGVLIFFSFAALILNYLLFESGLIPRWLSGWGLVGAALLLAEGLLEAFDVGDMTSIMSYPIALQEMVFAGWLIAKGFDPVAIASEHRAVGALSGVKRAGGEKS